MQPRFQPSSFRPNLVAIAGGYHHNLALVAQPVLVLKLEVHRFFGSYLYAGLSVAGMPRTTFILKGTSDARNSNRADWTPLATNTMASSN